MQNLVTVGYHRISDDSVTSARMSDSAATDLIAECQADPDIDHVWTRDAVGNVKVEWKREQVSTNQCLIGQPDCHCVNEFRFPFGYGRVGKQAPFDTVDLIRPGVVGAMKALVTDETVDRMFIMDSDKTKALFMWYAPDPTSRVGNWTAEVEGHSYCFTHDPDTDEVHCTTTGVSYGYLDVFGKVRWHSHIEAVIWTLDNIKRIAFATSGDAPADNEG